MGAFRWVNKTVFSYGGLHRICLRVGVATELAHRPRFGFSRCKRRWAWGQRLSVCKPSSESGSYLFFFFLALRQLPSPLCIVRGSTTGMSWHLFSYFVVQRGNLFKPILENKQRHRDIRKRTHALFTGYIQTHSHLQLSHL